MGDPVIRKHKHKQKKTKVAPTRPTVLTSEDNPIDQIFASKAKGKQKESALKATSDSKCPTPPNHYDVGYSLNSNLAVVCT
jgi:hypothetical protein